jgi:hypothetical protein
MVECTELHGKIVRSFRLYEDGPYGPEVSVTFDDDTSFTVQLKPAFCLHGSLAQTEGGETQIVATYDAPVSQP